MIKVAALRQRQASIAGGGGPRDHSVERAWRIHDEDGPTDLRVVLARQGMTVVRDYENVMLTCWHIGISPGDLARLVLPRIRRDER